MTRTFALSFGLGLLAAGCANEPSARLNAPPHGEPYSTRDSQGTFTYMSDNALLANMTVSDVHFLPHRAALSTLGEERLSRLAALVDAYGGTIRFNTDLTDADLIERRAETIRSFLAEAGIDTTSEVLVRDAPGGRGMAASEVILIRANEATYKPKPKGETASSGEQPEKP